MTAPAIIALLSAALALIEKIPPAVAALRQSSELTPEQEAELDEKIARLQTAAAPEHWKV